MAFPQIKKQNRGKFTKWAKANGFKDACSAASAVMKSTKKYSKPRKPNLPYPLMDLKSELLRTFGSELTKACAEKTKKNARALAASKFLKYFF